MKFTTITEGFPGAKITNRFIDDQVQTGAILLKRRLLRRVCNRKGLNYDKVVAVKRNILNKWGINNA